MAEGRRVNSERWQSIRQYVEHVEKETDPTSD